MTRNQRRKLAAARKAEKDARIISAFISQKQEAIVRKNMASPKPREHSRGLVSGVYNGSSAVRAHGFGVTPMNRTQRTDVKGPWVKALGTKF